MSLAPILAVSPAYTSQLTQVPFYATTCLPCPAPAAGLPVGTGQLLRSVSLFSLVNALAEKLRGVFVPYYGLLLDVCMAHLSGE